ncbi:MAG TPA: biopolymer transporter ExbD [Solibacterales bacterium]|nr:biopolymer transporter ExbD [Bryobacterales bacterium]
MGISVNGGGGGTGRRRYGSLTALSEMNVIPLVDVVLVLLIIFMLTAHVMEFGLEVEVPKVRTVKDSAEELPVITITRDGNVFLGDKPANVNALASEIRAQYGAAGKAVYVRADRNTIWEPMAQVISQLGEAKIDVRLMTQPEDEADRPRKR